MAIKLVKPARRILGKTPAKPLKAPARDTTRKVNASKVAAFGQASAEKKRIELERNKPFGLSIPVGGSATVYLLDRGEPFYHYEHNYGGGPGKRGRPLPCIKDSNEMCPVCSKEGKEGAYIMVLTCVVPVDKYKKKDGTTVTRQYQKKLFPVKIKMVDKYKRIYEKYGSFRGLVLKLHRDGEFDPATGSEVEVIKKLSEREIAAYATAKGIKNAENREHVIKAKIDEPFDYAEIYPPVTAAELAKMIHMDVGSGGPVGSEDTDDDFGADDDWGD